MHEPAKEPTYSAEMGGTSGAVTDRISTGGIDMRGDNGERSCKAGPRIGGSEWRGAEIAHKGERCSGRYEMLADLGADTSSSRSAPTLNAKSPSIDLAASQ
eukprot:scaffold305814_cov30-Tisochrysis_lutea.AAC.2